MLAFPQEQMRTISLGIIDLCLKNKLHFAFREVKF